MEAIDTMQAVFRRLNETAMNPSYDAAVRASARTMLCTLRERFAAVVPSETLAGLVPVVAPMAFEARP